MAITKVGKISNITPPKAVSNVTNASKTLQSQLQMKQQTLKKLSSNSSLSIDEKEKQREDNYRAVKEEQQHIEHTQPVQIKKTVQTPVYTEERTAVIERPAETGRAVYKGDGKKKSTQKIVYKAPK